MSFQKELNNKGTMKEEPVNLYQLLYKSYATRPLSVEEFADLLVDARVKNDSLGVTGILLYKNGVFIQLMEGEKRNIDTLYDVIKQDPRHTQLECLYYQPANERACKNWAMKIHNLDFGVPDNLLGVEQLISQLHQQHLSDGQSPAEQLITLFKQVS
ncbi:BLUF domain-containing protein [Psychrosphaera ytuae]|uniref:BLUF domain-containing protein n=1 Tax=Psychrosphaera ytuae TaxID=2820710 RepID=A0A975D9J9_9GAMM|nr:BLUF domain-containing protein [Psychrosphaera ytuae]QTH63036.1 BLUF domain-containing protein [Psychrosphaera ytuae]